MPSLVFQQKGATRPRRVPLFKRITTLGAAPECDLAIPGAGLAETHAHIHFDGKRFTLSALDKAPPIQVNDKKVRSAELAHKDRIQLGEAEVIFNLYDEPVDEGAELEATRLDAYRRMVEFSRALADQETLDALLDRLLDAVIELTRADKGMLILIEGEELRVKSARNLKRESIEDAVRQVSDSIVAKVVQSRQPIIVSDALHDEQFKNSSSVLNLKLCSVMAAPLTAKGNLLGLLYVGNNNLVNLFDQPALDVLSVFAGQASLLVQNALLLDELRLDNQDLRTQLAGMRFGEILGACQAMRSVFSRIEKVAPTDISVLISGETGTGKELVARRIHALSPRAKGPFVTINCGAIPENLLESELFGHVKGAFTGAVATRQGKFQAADGGTLFLDEIGELPLQLQVKLLRALQEKVITKVGDTRAESVDIRVLSASNRNLEREIKDGRFREDLYYRINVVNLTLPPLRERGDDIVAIAKYLLQKFAEEFGSRARGFSPSALAGMRKYHWPGNIRELENRLKKAVVLADKALISAEDMDIRAEDFAPILPLAQAKDDFQARYINEVLARNNGNRTKTARDLGVDPRTIFRHLEKMGAEGDEEPTEVEGDESAPGGS
ncbi:MAG TPA: sigma 54-interacting transcriptional regulator [Myxococcota bacterium]|nr:sigma 54-interacting transcriptional regulator [Myxococcota bacterium]HRY97060.1 sigma 54-interacting transcriptional regulator [Myxococcota bacterium]HSA20979.1 sigma 54-interacting transcriptional regulator [Myxococcota bacterium]